MNVISIRQKTRNRVNDDREMEWQTADGRIIKVKDFEDTHLANVMKHIQTYRLSTRFFLACIKEAKRRGLKKEFLERACIPYKKDGKWMVWSEEKRSEIEVG